MHQLGDLGDRVLDIGTLVRPPRLGHDGCGDGGRDGVSSEMGKVGNVKKQSVTCAEQAM